ASLDLRKHEEAQKETAARTELRRQQELAREQRRRAVVARVFSLVSGVIALLAIALAIGFVGASSDAERRSQAAYEAAVQSARQTARAKASLAQMENDNSRYFESAFAALSGISSTPSFDDDDQLACWAQLLRAA